MLKIIKSLVYRQKSIELKLKKFKKAGGHIGSDCEVFPDVEFGSEPYLINIGNHVRITNGVKFCTHDGGMWVLRNLGERAIPDSDKFGRIVIGNNVHIGWNTIIMHGVTVGDNVVIGCGAVVTHDIPSNSVAVGVPAKVIKTIDEYLKDNYEKIMHTKFMKQNEKRDFILKNL